MAYVMDATPGSVWQYCKKKYIKAKHVPHLGRKTYVVKLSDFKEWLDRPAQRARYPKRYWDRLG
jgi:hypothetical protein